MPRTYTLDEAQAILPEARERLATASSVLADLRQVLQGRQASDLGSDEMDRVEALERELEERLRWFDERSIRVKGISPGLLDLPARAVRDGEEIDVLLCWRDDEDTVAYYHPPDTGYIGREPVAMLDRV